MQKRYPYREVVTTIASGGSYDYLKSKQVKDEEILIITNIAYENKTGARGTFRRYIEVSGAEDVMLAETQGPGLAELVFSDKEQVVKAGEMMTVRQASCTASDVLKMYISGFKVFEDWVSWSDPEWKQAKEAVMVKS